MQKKSTLFHKLYLSYLTIIIISFIGIATYSNYALQNFYKKQTYKELSSLAQFAKAYITSLINENNPDAINKFCHEACLESDTRLTIILPNGIVIGDSSKDIKKMDNHANRPEIKQSLQKLTTSSETRFSKTLNTQMVYIAVPLCKNKTPIAIIRTSRPLTKIKKIQKLIFKNICFGGIIIGLLAAIISYFLSRRIFWPLDQMRAGAERIAQGDFSYKLPNPETKELSELATALRQMAKQLATRINTITAQQKKLEAILKSMHEGVIAIDGNNNIISINTAAINMLEITEKKLLDNQLNQIIRNPDIQNVIKDTLKTKQTQQKELIAYEQSKTKIFQAYSNILKDADNNPCGAVLVLNDVSRIKQLEMMRQDFVGNVSHELRTPITSIKGFVETLLAGAIDDPIASKRFLTIIETQSNRLNAIIEDLLLLSRVEHDETLLATSLSNLPLQDLLQNIQNQRKTKADKKNITLKLECPTNLKIKVNIRLLEQAVNNLIDNAINYSNPNSTVQIKVEETTQNIAINIIDHGCGIPANHLDRIFERFYRVDKGRSRAVGGTGLGLSIVKHIAQVHNGNVTVKSKPTQGSTFTITIPKTT